ncbi:MAG: hypothetical protein ABH872_00630 [Candidatus Omnitrophota bacterium]
MKIESVNKSQAMVEMAVLGTLLLVAVGIVVTYVAKLNNDQWVLMQAFRSALAKAHDTNEIVSYGTWDDRRMASVSEPILGQRITSSGSAVVHWSIPSVEGSGESPQDKTYVKVNGGMIPKLYEYDLGSGQSGGVEPIYITTKHSKVTIDTQNDKTQSTRSAGTAEAMIYKIAEKNYPQARYSGASRTLTGGK